MGVTAGDDGGVVSRHEAVAEFSGAEGGEIIGGTAMDARSDFAKGCEIEKEDGRCDG